MTLAPADPATPGMAAPPDRDGPAAGPDSPTTVRRRLRRTGRRPDTGSFAGPLRDLTPAQRLSVWLLTLTAGTLYGWVSVLRHQQFTTTIDITIFQQAIANYAQLRPPLVLVKSQEPFWILGDHFSPVMAALAPFYRVFPSVVTLLLGQAVLLAVAVFVVTRLAVRLLGGLGFAVGGAFAVSWGMLKVIDFDVHEVGFTVAFLALACAALVEDRRGWLLVWCGALVLTKEDSGLLVAGIGLTLVVLGDRRRGLGLVAAGLLAVAVTVAVLIPAFSWSGTWTYADNLGGGGSAFAAIGDMWTTTLRHLTEPRGWALLLALAATASLGLRSPVILILVPTLAARFASSREVYLEMSFYYDAPLMVVCFLALALAVADRRRRRAIDGARVRAWWSGAAGLATAAVCLLAVDAGISTTELRRTLAADGQECPWCDDARRLLDLVPDGERLIADVGLLGNAADRHPVLMANPQWQDSTHLPLQGDWVILYRDSDQFGAGWAVERERALLADGFRTLDQGSGLVLLHRPATGTRLAGGVFPRPR